MLLQIIETRDPKGLISCTKVQALTFVDGLAQKHLVGDISYVLAACQVS